MNVSVRPRSLAVVVCVCVAALVVPALAAASGTAVAPPHLVPCDPDPGVPGVVCGTVDVPIDRANPGLGTIPIYFEFFPRSDTSRPSLGTIVPSIGGPGFSDTVVRDLWRGMFALVLDRHDLLVVEHRGIGRSGAIDCTALQHFTGDLTAAVRACAAQLGPAAGHYSSGDVADDIDDVRAALGIDKLIYFGASYGGVDVRAYAYRHAGHLQSAVLDSPWATEDWTFTRANARFYAERQATVCRRSPSCIGANPNPAATLAWLARELRKHPFDGVGYDADGTAHALHVDESTIFAILSNDYLLVEPPFLNDGELTAAATALRAGDRTPLLRLAAESPDAVDSGDPTGFFSAGAAIATFCDDGRFAWDEAAPEADRQAQLEAAFAALPADAYTPFSAAAWREANERVSGGLLGGFAPDSCIPWAQSTPNKPFPPNQPFPNVPALVLVSDLDVIPPHDVRALLPLFPHAQFVQVASSGHVPGFWSPCAQAIELRFIATLHTGDTSCASDLQAPFHEIFEPPSDAVPYHGVGTFPLVAEQARPAAVDPRGGDRTTPSDRRVASVACAAVEDAVLRSMRMAGTKGRGLRGGSYTATHTDTTTTLHLHRTRFSSDTAVTGHATLDLSTHTLDAQVTVDGPGSHDGTLTLHGLLFHPTQPNIQIRGSLRGRSVTLLVPTN